MNISLENLDLDIPDEQILKRNQFQKNLKRGLDIIISLLIIGITFPVILLSCIAIRLESKGNPIYKQIRYGYKGEEFITYKLRTMYAHSSDGNLTAPKAGDPRVTRVGKLLRTTSIDEIPQFINVLKGEMSIIGPRAVPKKEIELRIQRMVALDSSKEHVYKKAMQIRQLMKPGISGMAQAYGRSSLTTEMATALDIFYIINYSIGLDIKIFFRTIYSILFQN